jgi:curved DNA-binding protein CbpA
MKTLYDLLDALPDDNAEDLRAAFRRAVKGTHPDMRPGDPDAALKFREIVRASEILGDTEQRAVYDDLLKVARLEQKSVGHPVAARMRRIASGMMALTWAATATAAGYFMFMYMSAAPASILSFETTAAFPPKSEHAAFSGVPAVPSAAVPENTPEVIPASDASATPDLAATEARSMPSEGLSTCVNSDLKIRFADLDEALQLDAKLLPAYVDPGVIFYRTEKSDAVFPDIAGAKRVEKAGHPKPAPATSRRRPLVPAAAATSVTAMSRTTAPDLSRSEAMASASAARWH